MKSNNIFYIIIFTLVLLIIVLAIFFFIRKKEENKLEQQNYVNSLIYLAGFEWDPTKNIYRSRHDALQRLGGYNSLYDDLSSYLYMVIDIEPIIFTYGEKTYMIELWKGQYGIATGCEIGIYINSKNRPDRYYCATDDDMIQMSYTLINNKSNTKIFERSDIHWWLTGFKPGIFNNPDDLTMENISLTFKDNGMADAFKSALLNLSNKDQYNISISGKTVKFRWTTPSHLPQPKNNNTDAVTWCQQMAGLTNTVMKGNFDPSVINIVFLEFLNFSQTNDAIDNIIDWFLVKDDNEEKRKQLVQNDVKEWSKNHGDNMINIFAMLAFLKSRWDLASQFLKPFIEVCKIIQKPDFPFLNKYNTGLVKSLCLFLNPQKS